MDRDGLACIHINCTAELIAVEGSQRASLQPNNPLEVQQGKCVVPNITLSQATYGAAYSLGLLLPPEVADREEVPSNKRVAEDDREDEGKRMRTENGSTSPQRGSSGTLDLVSPDPREPIFCSLTRFSVIDPTERDRAAAEKKQREEEVKALKQKRSRLEKELLQNTRDTSLAQRGIKEAEAAMLSAETASLYRSLVEAEDRREVRAARLYATDLSSKLDEAKKSPTFPMEVDANFIYTLGQLDACSHVLDRDGSLAALYAHMRLSPAGALAKLICCGARKLTSVYVCGRNLNPELKYQAESRAADVLMEYGLRVIRSTAIQQYPALEK